MPFATGPWHSPPQLPDDPGELCLVLLFRQGAHHRYAAMRYAGGWQHQNGEALDTQTWVSRWAYITSSIEHLRELPPVHALPVESRLFVADALTHHEEVRLLTAYVGELKHNVAALQAALAKAQEKPPSSERLSGQLRALENERQLQLASRDARIAEQRAKLKDLHEAVQRLTALAAKADKLRAQLDDRDRMLGEQKLAMAALKQELKHWRTRAEAATATEALRREIAARDKKIHDQRRTLAELEELVGRLRQQRIGQEP
jgi:hypothetical protein